jgi:hypothetical protein
VIQVQAMKRSGYRLPGSDKVFVSVLYVLVQAVNPNEKAGDGKWLAHQYLDRAWYFCHDVIVL